jgi:hypothetical protein
VHTRFTKAEEETSVPGTENFATNMDNKPKDLKQTQEELLATLNLKDSRDIAIFKTVITVAWMNGYESGRGIARTIIRKALDQN